MWLNITFISDLFGGEILASSTFISPAGIQFKHWRGKNQQISKIYLIIKRYLLTDQEFSCASCKLHVLASSFDWFICLWYSTENCYMHKDKNNLVQSVSWLVPKVCMVITLNIEGRGCGLGVGGRVAGTGIFAPLYLFRNKSIIITNLMYNS